MPRFKKLNWMYVFALFALLAACGDGSKPASNSVLNVSDGELSCDAVDEHSGEDNPLRQSTVRESLESLGPLIGNVRARDHQSLNGQWRYLVDQLGVGDNSVLLRGGVGENESYDKDEVLEYAFSDNYTLQVPGDWNTQEEALFWYRGIIWYQRAFDYTPVEGERAHLYFGGGNYRKDVYVNGQFIAQHEGGFTPFNVDVTDYLVAGENGIVVKVDSLSGPDKVPTEYNDWKNYGGLTRDIMLVKTPEKFIRNYKLQLNPDQPENIRGWVEVDGGKKGDMVTLRIAEAAINEEFTLNADGYAEFDFAAPVERWSPQSPKLYAVEWRLAEGDSISDSIGFRTVSTEGEEILLNGKPVFLRGISVHEESLLTSGRAATAADADALVASLKELNANYVRLAHYPHNEHIVRAAEKAGIMMWSELPVYHDVQFANPCTLASAKQQYSEMIARDQNRAGIILWSLGNETPESEARNTFFRNLGDYVRQADNTRPLAAALLTSDAMIDVGLHFAKVVASQKSSVIDFFLNPDPVVMEINDPLGEIVDVIGINVYLGWYLSGPFTQELKSRGFDVTEGDIREMVLKEIPSFSLMTPFGKPVIISEVGAGAKQGFRGGPLDAWTEDLQANIYEAELQFIENMEAVRGISPWILKDFRSPYRINTVMQDYWNRKGLLSETGEKKLAFGVLSDYYKTKEQAEAAQ